MEQRLVELMFKAVRGLPADEQDEVLRGLIAGIGAPGHAELPGLAAAPRSRIDRLVAGTRLLPEAPTVSAVSAVSGPETELKMLPVRLPVADYERLRAFSREHGFSMAVIIRTLVERFLDERAPQVDPEAGAAK
jgi:hypothetical protein